MCILGVEGNLVAGSLRRGRVGKLHRLLLLLLSGRVHGVRILTRKWVVHNIDTRLARHFLRNRRDAVLELLIIVAHLRSNRCLWKLRLAD